MHVKGVKVTGYLDEDSDDISYGGKSIIINKHSDGNISITIDVDNLCAHMYGQPVFDSIVVDINPNELNKR